MQGATYGRGGTRQYQVDLDFGDTDLEGADREQRNSQFYFALSELAPAPEVRVRVRARVSPNPSPKPSPSPSPSPKHNCNPNQAYLSELPTPFSTAPTAQLVAAGGLGAANLAGVLYLGALLPSNPAPTPAPTPAPPPAPTPASTPA